MAEATAIVPYIPVDAPDELKEYVKSAIVKLKHTTFFPRGKDGTAFFVRYKSESGEICHGLMTNHHVINFDPAEPIVGGGWEGKPPDPLTVSLFSEKFQFTEELKLEESSISYAFSCSRLDVTVVELSPNKVDELKAKGVNFLEMERDVSASYGDCLHIYGHPGGGQLCKGEGRLVGQPTPLICYSVDTGPGFSGSPIFKVIMVDRHENSFRYQLVGIHHRAGDKNKYNCGTPIETVIRAIDRDKPIAQQELLYPLEQMENAKEDILIQHLFGVDLNVAKDLDPPIDRVSVFDHVDYYGKPRFYKINSGNVEMTLSHSLEWDQFTLMDVLHSEQIAVPWRDFGVNEFKAFHKLAMALQRVCSLERSGHTGTAILNSLEQHLQQMLDKVSLAEYYCRNGNEQRQMATIQKLTWAVMCKDGPEHLAQALVATRSIQSKELKAKLNQFKCKETTEVELIETTTACLTAITSQLRTLGRPPAALKTHVQRMDAVAELSKLVTTSFEEEEQDTEDEMRNRKREEKTWAVVLLGMGGIGKTHLVLDVLQSPSVQRAFPNVIWHEVGQLTDAALEENVKKLAECIGADSGSYTDNNIQAIKRKLQEPQFKETILVVDNVWSSDTARNFLFDFPTIFTSRVWLIFDTDQRMASYQVPNGFTLHETTKLFEKSAKTDIDKTAIKDKAVEISELHSFCGGHPLVIAILARNIASKIEQGRNGWDVVTDLETAGLKVAELPKSEPISQQRHRNVLAMLRAILETMEAEDRNCLFALRICKRGAKLTRNALRALWMDCVKDSDKEANYLRDQALLQGEHQNVFNIHDVIFDLIAKTGTNEADTACHRKFIENFEHCICPFEQVPQTDIYMTLHCGYHLLQGNLKERWVSLFVRNLDFLEELDKQRIDLFVEFSLAERLFLQEEENSKNQTNNSAYGPLLPLATLPIYFTHLFRSVQLILKPRKNTHTAFITEVTQTLIKLIERHGRCPDTKRQLSQERMISQITRMLSVVLFTHLRNQTEEPTTDSTVIYSKWPTYLRATEVSEKGLSLISAIEEQAEPAVIQRLVGGMQLASFFQTDASGETCMHVAMRHDKSDVIFDILKGAEVWNEQSKTEELKEQMNEMEKLNVAGSNTLLRLSYDFEDHLSSYTSQDNPLLFEGLETFTTKPYKDTISTLIHGLDFRHTDENLVKAVLQSSIFQAHQFATKNTSCWRTIKQTNEGGSVAPTVYGLSFMSAFVGIRETLDQLYCNYHCPTKGCENEWSWKGLISAQTHFRETPLTLAACHNGCFDIVEKLLQESVNCGEEFHYTYVNHGNYFGTTALHYACTMGYSQLVSKLLDNSADIVKANDVGYSCLHLSSNYGHHDTAEMLIVRAKKMGGQLLQEQLINHKAYRGVTALQSACSFGHKKIVELLLNNSAGYLHKDEDGNTCLQWAVCNKQSMTVRQLLKYIAEKKDKDELKQLADHQNNKGETALHQACYKGSVEIVDILMSYCADVCLQDVTGDTCLQNAVLAGHSIMIEHIVKHVKKSKGQKSVNDLLNQENKRGLTVFDMVFSFNQKEALQLLLDSCIQFYNSDVEKEAYLRQRACLRAVKWRYGVA